MPFVIHQHHLRPVVSPRWPPPRPRVSKLFFNSELGEQLPHDARRDALNAEPTRRKQHRRPLPGPYGGNDAGTFTIAHDRPAAW